MILQWSAYLEIVRIWEKGIPGAKIESGGGINTKREIKSINMERGDMRFMGFVESKS